MILGPTGPSLNAGIQHTATLEPGSHWLLPSAGRKWWSGRTTRFIRGDWLSTFEETELNWKNWIKMQGL